MKEVEDVRKSREKKLVKLEEAKQVSMDDDDDDVMQVTHKNTSNMVLGPRIRRER